MSSKGTPFGAKTYPIDSNFRMLPALAESTDRKNYSMPNGNSHKSVVVYSLISCLYSSVSKKVKSAQFFTCVPQKITMCHSSAGVNTLIFNRRFQNFPARPGKCRVSQSLFVKRSINGCKRGSQMFINYRSFLCGCCFHFHTTPIKIYCTSRKSSRQSRFLV